MDTIEYLSTADARNFVRKYENADIQQLILNPPAGFKEKIILLADQIISHKKAKEKLPGWVQQEGVIMPPPISVEQSSSQLTSSYKSTIFKGDHLVDLTGGMGIDCLQLSTTFNQVTYVEQNEWLCHLFRHNHPLLSENKFNIIKDTAATFLKGFEGKASFFIDPGRRSKSKKVFQFEDCSPNMLELLPALTAKSDQVLIKTSPMMDIQKGIFQLGKVDEVHVVSVDNECKEVLYLCDPGKTNPVPKILCINIDKGKISKYSFNLQDEKELTIKHLDPGNFLYDPNTSILKAGAFKSITLKYPVQKIAPNTHLYTSDELIRDFPGRVFKIVNKDPSKKELARLEKANVITKNYPLKPEAIRKKFKLKDGGENYLIGYRDRNDRTVLNICEKY